MSTSNRYCGRLLRSKLRCHLEKGHRGRCAGVAFQCDDCGRMRRGYPEARNEDVQICFMCVNDVESYPAKIQKLERQGYFE